MTAMGEIRKSFLSLSFGLVAALFLTACGGAIKTEARYPTGADRDGQQGGDIYAKPASILGDEGLSFGGKKEEKDDGSSGIAVNSFLWRASLDTVSFMPLASADPFGGVILTDWHSPAENADARFKLNIFILDRALRADGIRVRVFKQVRGPEGWRDARPAAATARRLEDTILTRARQLRIAQLDPE